MNSVASERRATASRPDTTSPGIVMLTFAPRKLWSFGRGRSVGSSSGAGPPVPRKKRSSSNRRESTDKKEVLKGRSAQASVAAILEQQGSVSGRSGYLLKQGVANRAWKERWFVLPGHGPLLLWYGIGNVPDTYWVGCGSRIPIVYEILARPEFAGRGAQGAV